MNLFEAMRTGFPGMSPVDPASVWAWRSKLFLVTAASSEKGMV